MSDEFNFIDDTARRFHEAYERLAPDFGYETRKESAVPWENVPDQNKNLMRAVIADLFQTAEPEESSKLRTIDLPTELREAARTLRADAEAALDSNPPAEAQGVADRLGFLANVVEDVSHLIVEPARMLQALMRDRDTWQALEKQLEEMLATTEAALGVSQKSNVALAEGQSKLLELLERVARHFESNKWKLDRDLVLSKDGVLIAHWYGGGPYAPARVVEEHNKEPDVLPEIHATLAQVTAIETDSDGRLVVAQQPDDPEPEAISFNRSEPEEPSPIPSEEPAPEPAPPVIATPGTCRYCGKPTGDTHTICDDCMPL